MRTLTLAVLCALLSLGSHGAGAQEERPEWALTVYNAWLTQDALGELFVFNAELESDFQLLSVALSKRMWSLNRHLDIEAEGQVVKHVAGQNHWEINGLGAVRWRTFPWDQTLDTSMAVGVGISFASETPEFEVDRKGKSGKTMAYLMWELALALPGRPDWELVARIHHRSAAFGLFEEDVKGASNAFGFGIKYRF